MFYTRFAAAALLSACLGTTDAAPINSSSTTFHPPHIKTQQVMQAHFADPGLLKDGDTWYSYATNNGKQNVQVATSTDFKKWTLLEGWDALPHAGAWSEGSSMDPSSMMKQLFPLSPGGAPTDLKSPMETVMDLAGGRWPWSNAPPAVWAPDAVKTSLGTYVLYYSAQQRGQKRHCVGAAVSLTSPKGPFTPNDEPLACHEDQGGAIDPSGFVDTDGTRYVVYKVDGNNAGNGGLCGNTKAPQVPTPIMLQEVAPDGVTKVGEPLQILDRGAADGPLVEAPSITRTADGKYVLFFSSNCYSTDLYDIGYASAESVKGPYTKGGPFAVTGTAGLTAPGGATVAQDGKHMVFHAADGKGGRAMFTAEISFAMGADKMMKVTA